MAKTSLISLSLCVLFLLHSCAAQTHQRWPGQQHRPAREQSECNLQSISAIKPTIPIKSEGGITEFWDENQEQLDCAGVAASRRTIEPRGLVLPSFSNAPKLVYVLKGRGVIGFVIPGCPETYQSFQQSQGGGQQGFRDENQKLRRVREGDVIAFPAGVVHWCYNDGEERLVVVAVHDTSNDINQLDRNLRKFQLAGGHQDQQGLRGCEKRPTAPQCATNSILGGIKVETLMEAFRVSRDTATKLQGRQDNRGEIVLVEEGFQIQMPESLEQERQDEPLVRTNGLEETICNMRLRENVGNPNRADIFNPQAGRITTLNSQKLPILNNLQLSAERGFLYSNAILAPQWNINAHSVVYVIRGRGYAQIVGNYDKPVFDGELSEGQLVVVPQNFAVVIRAGDKGFEYIAFKTNDNAIVNPLVGRSSTFRGQPVEVLMNAYQISKDEALNLKFSRDELTILGPRSRSPGRASA